MAVEEFETTCPNCKKDFDVRSDDREVVCPHCDARVQLVEPGPPPPTPYVPPAPSKVVVKDPQPVPAPYIPPAPAKVVGAAKPEPKAASKPAKVAKPPEQTEPARSREGRGFARLNFLTRRERTPLDSQEAVPILEIEGVGPTYAAKLQKAGIVSSDDLLGKDLAVVAKKSGVPLTELRKWQDMADLIHVKGIGPQFAEVLVRADINSVAELARQEPRPLAAKIQALLDSKAVTIVGVAITSGRTKAWIKEARRMAPPPKDVGKAALKAVQGKPEPAEEVGAQRAGKVNDRELAKEAKKEAERSFLSRFARRSTAPPLPKAERASRTTIGDDIPVSGRSLFRRDPEAAARRAAEREARKSQKQKDSESKAKAKAAADATKAAERDAAAKAKATADAQRKGEADKAKAEADKARAAAVAAKLAEREAAAKAKAKTQPQPPLVVVAPAAVKPARAVPPRAPTPAAAKAGVSIPFLKRGPLESVACAHCGHAFTVKASQRKATCPNCHSRLALVAEGQPLPAVAVDVPKAAPGAKPAAAAPPAPAPAKVGKAAPIAKAAAPLVGVAASKPKADQAKAQVDAASAKAKAKADKAAAKAKAKEERRQAKAARKEEKFKLKVAKAAAKEAAAKAKAAGRPEKPEKGKPVPALAAPPTKAGKRSDKALANAAILSPKAAAKAASRSDDQKAAKLKAQGERAKAKAARKAAKLAAKEQKRKDKAAARAAKLAAKGNQAKAEQAKILAPAAEAKHEPQCAALTDEGAQCRNSARKGSQYCRSHKGYQPPTAKGLAQRIEGKSWRADKKPTDKQSVAAADTRPVVKKAEDTKLKERKPSVPFGQRLGGLFGGKGKDKAGKPAPATTAKAAPLSEKKAEKLKIHEEKRKARAARAAAKLAAKEQKARAKASAKAAKLAAKGEEPQPAAVAAGKAAAGGTKGKETKAQPARGDLSPRQQAKLDKQRAKDEERRKREMERRQAEKDRLSGLDSAGLWAQAVARPLPRKTEGHGVWEDSVETRRATATEAPTRAERKAALKGKVRLVDGRSLFSRLPEDHHERKPPRLPTGESPFKHLDEDVKVPAPKPRLGDGRSAFERLPEDEQADYDRIHVFGHKPGREYTTRGGFHITEEVVAAEAAPEVELGTKRDRASRKQAKEEERKKKKEAKEARKASQLAAREDARKRREERAAAGKPIAPAAGAKPAKTSAATDATALVKPAEPKLTIAQRIAKVREARAKAAEARKAESKSETRSAAKGEGAAPQALMASEKAVSKSAKAVAAKAREPKQSFVERLQARQVERARLKTERAKAKTAAKSAKAAAKLAATGGHEPQCAALTDDGAQCRNSARAGSQYCRSHKGYQPPTAQGLAKRIEGKSWTPGGKPTDRQSVAAADTLPAAKKAEDTKLKVRKPSVPLTQRLRGLLPGKARSSKAAQPTKAAPAKPAAKEKSKPGKAKASGPSLAERLKALRTARAKAGALKAKQREAAKAEKLKLKQSKAKQADAAKLAKAKAAAAESKLDAAKARAAPAGEKDRRSAQIAKAKAKEERRAARLAAKAERKRLKALARTERAGAKEPHAPRPAQRKEPEKDSAKDAARDKLIRAAQAETLRLEGSRVRAVQKEQRKAARAAAKEDRRLRALAKAEAKAVANGESKAPLPVEPAVAAPSAVASPAAAASPTKPEPSTPAWEPTGGRRKLPKAAGRRIVSAPAAASETPWTARPVAAAPLAPAAKTTTERVPVQRTIEKTVRKPLVYDRARIDALLRSHGQQPPR